MEIWARLDDLHSVTRGCTFWGQLAEIDNAGGYNLLGTTVTLGCPARQMQGQRKMDICELWRCLKEGSQISMVRDLLEWFIIQIGKRGRAIYEDLTEVDHLVFIVRRIHCCRSGGVLGDFYELQQRSTCLQTRPVTDLIINQGDTIPVCGTPVQTFLQRDLSVPPELKKDDCTIEPGILR